MTQVTDNKTDKNEVVAKTVRRAFVFGLPGFLLGAVGVLGSSQAMASKKGYPPPKPTFADYFQSFMATFPSMLTSVIDTVQDTLNIGGEKGDKKKQVATAIAGDSQINTLIDIENKRIVDASESAPSNCLHKTLGTSLSGLSKEASRVHVAVQTKNISASMSNRSAAKKSLFARASRYLDEPGQVERNLQISSQFFLMKEGYKKKHIARYFIDNLKGELEFLSTAAPSATLSGSTTSNTGANVANSRKLTFVSRVSVIDQALETIYMDRVRHVGAANTLRARTETVTEKSIIDSLAEDGGSSIVDLINFEVERTASSTDGGWADRVDEYMSAVPLHKELLELIAFKNYVQLGVNKQAEIINQLNGLQALIKIEEGEV